MNEEIIEIGEDGKVTIPKQIVYAIEQECDDSYYGYFVIELFKSKKKAEFRAMELRANNCYDYRITEMEVQE